MQLTCRCCSGSRLGTLAGTPTKGPGVDETEKGTTANRCPTCGSSEGYEAQLRERARLARELHDSVVQQVFSMRMHAKALRAEVAPGHVGDPDRVCSAADELLGLTQQALADLRALVLRLHPTELTGRGLAAAVCEHAESVRSASGLRIDVAVDELPELPVELKEDLFRIVQEALHNVVKHAEATRATIRLRRTDSGEIALDIDDNGVGYRRDRVGGVGLTSMRERARRWGGSMEIGNIEIGNEAQGCRVGVRVPWAPGGRRPQAGGATPR